MHLNEVNKPTEALNAIKYFVLTCKKLGNKLLTRLPTKPAVEHQGFSWSIWLLDWIGAWPCLTWFVMGILDAVG